MFYEETIVNGKLYFRLSPDGEWLVKYEGSLPPILEISLDDYKLSVEADHTIIDEDRSLDALWFLSHRPKEPDIIDETKAWEATDEMLARVMNWK